MTWIKAIFQVFWPVILMLGLILFSGLTKVTRIMMPDGHYQGYAKIVKYGKHYDFCFECLPNSKPFFPKDEVIWANGNLYYCEFGSKADPLIY